MANPELVRTLDYILNRCDKKSIEAVAAAVVRRRRELSMFGGMSSLPNPGHLARELSSQMNIEGAIEGLRNNIRDYAMRIIQQEAPELTEDQIEKLTQVWIPEPGDSGKKSSASRGLKSLGKNSKKDIPRNLLASMIDQFVMFSLGKMEEEEDKALRREMGPWPDKYWNHFPQVIRLLISDYLKGEIAEGDFNTRIGLALSMQ